jgi:hypothetical protein
MRDGLLKTLESPTARRLADDYVKIGLPAKLSMMKVEGSQRAVYQGRVFLTIKSAETFVNDNSTIAIRFNDLMLGATSEAPNSIAHELFGHALDWSRAVKDGSFPAYDYADSAELNAKLVGWTIDQELGDPADKYDIDDYFADTTTYMDRHRFDAPSHCLGLSRAEMADARAAYQARLDRLLSDRTYFKSRLPSSRNEIGWIDHFIEVHGMKPGPFANLKKRLRLESGVEIPGELRVRRLSEGMLRQRVALFSKKKNRKILAEVAQDPLVAAWDARTAEFTELLRGVYKAKETPAEIAAKNGPKSIDRPELKKMIDVDLVGCPFADRPD